MTAKRLRERSGHRAALKWTGAAMAFLFVLLGLAFAGLHLSGVRNAVWERAARFLDETYGVAVSIDGFDYNLIRMEFDLASLGVRSSGQPDSPPFFEAARVSLDLDTRDLLGGDVTIDDAAIDGAIIRVAFGPDGESNLPTFGPGEGDEGSTLRVRHLGINGSSAVYTDSGSERSLLVPAWQLELTGVDEPDGRYSIDAAISSGTGLETNGFGIDFGEIDGSFLLEPGTIEVATLDVRSGAGEATVSGTVSTLDPITTNLDVRATSDLELLAAMLGIETAVDGSLRMDARVSGPVDSPEVEGEVAGADLRLERFESLDLASRFSWNLAENAIGIETLSVDAPIGRFTASGAVDLAASGVSTIQVGVDSVELDELTRMFELPVEIASRASGNLTLMWPGSEWEQVDAMGELRLEATRTAIADGVLPLAGSVGIGGSLDRATFDLMPLGPDNFTARGRMTLSAGNQIEGHIDAAAGDTATLVAGVRRFLGNAAGEEPPYPTGPFTVSLSVSGSLGNPRLGFALDAPALGLAALSPALMPVSLSAEGEYADRRAEIAQARIGWNGETLAASGEVTFEAGAPQLDVQALGTAVSLGNALAAFGRGEIPLTGSVDLTSGVRGPIDELVIQTRVQSNGFNLYDEPFASADARVTLDSDGFQVSELVLARGEPESGGTVSGTGRYQWSTEDFEMDLSGADLDLDGLPVPGIQGFGGTAIFELGGRGTLSDPELNIDLAVDNASYERIQLGDVQLDGTFGGGRFQVEARAPQQNLSATADLETTGAFPITARFETAGLDAGMLAALLGIDTEAVNGSIEASGEVSGELADWRNATALVEVPLAELSLGAQDIRAGPAVVRYDQRRLQFEPFTLTVNEQQLEIAGNLPIDAVSDDGTIAIRGALDVEALPPLLYPGRPLRADGTLAVDIALSGTFEDFSTTGRFAWRDGVLEVPGSPDLLRPIEADLRILDDALILDEITAFWWGSEIVAEGRLPLALVSDLFGDPAATGPATVGAIVSNVGMRSIPGMPEGLDGSADILVDLETDRFTLEDLRGRARLRRLVLTAADIGVEPGDEIVMRVADGRVRIEPFTLIGPGTTFDGDGEFGLTGERDLRIDLAGEADTAIFSSRVPSVASSGRVDLEFGLRGTLFSPEASGGIRIEGGMFEVESPPIEVREFNAAIEVTPEAITLESLSGVVNDGTVEARGRALYSGWNPTRVEIDLTARDLYLEAPDEMRTISDADISARSEGNLINLTGSVQILEGSYTGNVDLNDWLLGSGPGDAPFLTEQNPVMSRIRYDIPIETLDSIVVENNVAELQADINARLTGSYYQPGLVGRVFVAEGGTIEVQETQFVLDAGVIDFLNPNRIEPTFSLSAQTSTSGYDVTLQVSGGGGTDPEAVLTSNPPLSEPEIAALLLTGRTIDEIRGAGLNVAREQALSYATGALGGRISRNAQETLGLSRVSIQPNLIANESDPGARLTVGQDVTRNLELIYSMNLTDSNDQIWIAEYDIRRGLVTRSVKQEDNTYRFELRHDLSFGGAPQQSPALTVRLQRTIGEIRFEPEFIEGRSVRGILGLDPGDAYDPLRFRQRQQRVRDYLTDRGFLEARVNVDRIADAGTIDLAVRVNSGPRVQFEYDGANVRPALRRSVTQAWREASFDSVRTRTALERMREDFVANGHLEVRADVQVSQTADTKTVRFAIETGPRYSNIAVDFPGATRLSPESLRRTLRDAGLWTAVTLDPAEVQTFLGQHYAANGYLDAAIELPETSLDASGSLARIAVRVSEGPEYRVGRMLFSGNDSIESGQLDDGFESTGRVFRPAMLDTATDLVYQHYWNRGFNDVVVSRTLAPNAESGEVDFVFSVEEGGQDIIDEIEVAGNLNTSENLVRTHLELAPGEPVRIEALTRTRRNLYNTGAYSLVDVETIDLNTPDGSAGRQPVRLRFNLREVPPYSVRYGGFYDTERGIGGIVDFRNQNSLGDARTLGVRGRYDSQLREVRTYFSQPILGSLPLKSDASVFVRHELETALINESVGFSLQQETRLSELYLLSYGYSFEHTRTYDRIPDGGRAFEPPREIVNVAPLTATLTRDTRDDLLDASRGVFMSHSLEFAPDALGSDSGLIRYFGQWFRYRPISEPTEIPYSGGVRKSRFVYAGGVRLGLAAGLDGAAVPLSRRFFAGGGTTIRGFDQDLVGPMELTIDGPNPVGGDAVLIINNELRFPILNIFDGIAFLDAGNVYRRVRDFDLFRLRSSAGLGLRVRTPYFLLRADYGFNLNRRPGESAGTLFFSIGQAF